MSTATYASSRRTRETSDDSSTSIDTVNRSRETIKTWEARPERDNRPAEAPPPCGALVHLGLGVRYRHLSRPKDCTTEGVDRGQLPWVTRRHRPVPMEDV